MVLMTNTDNKKSNSYIESPKKVMRTQGEDKDSKVNSSDSLIATSPVSFSPLTKLEIYYDEKYNRNELGDEFIEYNTFLLQLKGLKQDITENYSDMRQHNILKFIDKWFQV